MAYAPPWEAGFLKALAETGVATQAAKCVGITVRAATKRRAANSTFAAAWQAAADLHRAEAANGALSAAGELVVNRRGGGQVARAGQTRWGKRAEEAFLNEMAASASVRRAAAACGFTAQSIYGRRRRDRRFAEAWDEAVAVGRARIEAYLVEAADRSFDPESLAVTDERPTMSVAEAIKVLQLTGRSASSRTAKAKDEFSGRGWIGPESWDDSDDDAAADRARQNIMERLDRIREREEERKLAEGWTRYGDDWVPPGFAPVADVKALPHPDQE